MISKAEVCLKNAIPNAYALAYFYNLKIYCEAIPFNYNLSSIGKVFFSHFTKADYFKFRKD